MNTPDKIINPIESTIKSIFVDSEEASNTAKDILSEKIQIDKSNRISSTGQSGGTIGSLDNPKGISQRIMIGQTNRE